MTLVACAFHGLYVCLLVIGLGVAVRTVLLWFGVTSLSLWVCIVVTCGVFYFVVGALGVWVFGVRSWVLCVCCLWG